MSTVAEIETALKGLSRPQAQEVSRWLQQHLEQPVASGPPGPARPPLDVPDYAARRRKILGDKVLPNMVLAARDGERW